MNSEMRASSLELKLGASQKKWELLMPQRSVTVIIGIGTTKSCEWPKKPAIHNDKDTFFWGGECFLFGRDEDFVALQEVYRIFLSLSLCILIDK